MNGIFQASKLKTYNLLDLFEPFATLANNSPAPEPGELALVSDLIDPPAVERVFFPDPLSTGMSSDFTTVLERVLDPTPAPITVGLVWARGGGRADGGPAREI